MTARLQGVEAGIDHGTVRGFRQHKRRHVPVCPSCQSAVDSEKDTDVFRAPVAAVRPLTVKERRESARLLASRAVDADELRGLLALTGLTAEDGKAVLDEP